MVIETKFSIGEKVKVYADKINKYNCPFCNGDGSKEIDGRTFHCKNCDGDRIIEIVSDKEVAVNATIKGITIKVRDDISEEYSINEYYKGHDGNFYSEEYIVKLEDEDNYYNYVIYGNEEIIKI